ncbi:MAG: glycosyltransferase, partial [bacterium]
WWPRALSEAITDLPKASVILNTYNRASQVGKAVESVLSQSGVDLELVIVDDGSTDDTQAVLAVLADARTRCLRQSNRGLAAARNVGAREARGDWLLFLDDDDRLCEGALEALLTATTDPSCRVVVGGVCFVDSDGRTMEERVPKSLDGVMAGMFLISRTLFDVAGGYLEGMPCSHQTELFLRVRQVLGEGVGAAAFVTRPVVEVERRPAAGRPQRSPSNAYFGGRWIVARHPDQYTSRRERAVLQTIAGVNAMRIGREADARRRFASAVRLDPLSLGRYARLGGAFVSPIGRRIWLRQWDTAPKAQRPLDRLQRRADHDGATGRLPLERDPSPGPDSLFLPWRYRQNPAGSPDVRRSLFWEEGLGGDVLPKRAPIHKLAGRLAGAKGLVPVIDVGYGVEGAGTDDETFWEHVARLKPQLVICADVVQQVPDPRRLLSGIGHAVSDGGMALISTPDRTRLRPETPMGPPSIPNHIREWSPEEFSLLLESCGFEVVRIVHRRSSMGFLVHPMRS